VLVRTNPIDARPEAGRNETERSPSVPSTVAGARAQAAIALTLDLDDTLWPIAPVIDRCETALERFLDQHAPAVAQRFPRRTLRAVRDAVFAQRPDLAYDFTAVRRISLERAFAEAGVHAPDTITAACELFYATRNQVEFYTDIEQALPALAARHRLLALSNGTADLVRIGIDHHFHGALLARDIGCGKPDPRIFAHACRLLDCPPAQIWHVGDDPELDVLGAQRAGLHAVWLNRDGRDWPADLPPPDRIVRDLTELDTVLAGHA
jgi:FMN hydrolase / 5-amino-6-(5-phospho-D-ribitylamino)uracil phosphatase